MEPFTILPTVDSTQEFIEIANDFSNPLDVVREAISNSYDAKATIIDINFEVEKINGESILVIVIRDNGVGMSRDNLHNFFDLGNSFKRSDKSTIGEKGHGTKVFFNSQKVTVKTKSENSNEFVAAMDRPFSQLHERIIPIVSVTENESHGSAGTEITIIGYNNNRREKFTQSILKDFIYWYTRHGTIQNQFGELTSVTIRLKGLGIEVAENLPQGHPFPDENCDIQALFNQHVTKSPDYYCKRIVRTGQLKNFPEISYQAVFSIEGKYSKYQINPMLRRPGYTAPAGSYTIQERYGLWICKDFFPIQRKNEWITFKGSEYTKFHAFINCQDLRLTANRGSVDNTPTEIQRDLQAEVLKIYDSIVKSDDWTSMEWLEEESAAYQTTEKERSNFSWRLQKVNRSNVASYKGITLVEPERESGVFSIMLQMSILEPPLFPFHIIDYDTHEGVDVIVKGDNTTPIVNSKLFYVELKRNLGPNFNHAFENIHSIVCWESDIKHNDLLRDINNEERKMQILAPKNSDDYTRYFLDNPRKAHKIEVFALKTFLKEKLNIDFVPRTADAVV